MEKIIWHSTPQKTNRAFNSKTVEHDVITLLKIDHAEFKRMFSAYEKLIEKNDTIGKEKLANKIFCELIAHTLSEEEIFYPHARKATQDDAMLNEGLVEHEGFKKLVAQLLNMKNNDEMYDAKIKVLGEYLIHHIDEEDKEMFPAVQKTKELDLRKMAKDFVKRKNDLIQKLSDENGRIDLLLSRKLIKSS